MAKIPDITRAIQKLLIQSDFDINKIMFGLNALLERHPEVPDLWFLKGQLHTTQNQASKARTAFRNVRKLQPKLLCLPFEEVELALHRHDVSKAVELIEDGILGYGQEMSGVLEDLFPRSNPRSRKLRKAVAALIVSCLTQEKHDASIKRLRTISKEACRHALKRARFKYSLSDN